jgi:flagellar hook-length control protein FliK
MAQAVPSVASDPGPETATIKSEVTLAIDAFAMRPHAPQSVSSAAESAPARQILDQPGQSTLHPAPAMQVAPALIALTRSNGVESVTVRLQPAELGQVNIRVDRTIEGVAHVDITAERPETLQLLQRDEPRLQQALDQAGIQPSGRTVSFQVAAPEQTAASTSRPGGMEAGFGNSGQGQSGGAWRQSDDGRHDPGADANSDQGRTRVRWFRAGLDITA